MSTGLAFLRRLAANSLRHALAILDALPAETSARPLQDEPPFQRGETVYVRAVIVDPSQYDGQLEVDLAMAGYASFVPAEHVTRMPWPR